MIYAVSDLHGCYDKYLKLLDRLKMSDDDTLYILGDIVDRGDGGIKILLDLTCRQNIRAYRGNHDYYALTLLKSLVSHHSKYSTEKFIDALKAWLSDGGNATYAEYIGLNITQKNTVLNYLNSLPLFEELTVGGQKFFLSHTVPEKEKMLQMDKCRPFDFLMGEPNYEKKYFEDTIIVTGHTPTGFINPDYLGRIWRGNNHIAIDCGAVFGNPLGCICLDTMEEIYVE